MVWPPGLAPVRTFAASRPQDQHHPQFYIRFPLRRGGPGRGVLALSFSFHPQPLPLLEVCSAVSPEPSGPAPGTRPRPAASVQGLRPGSASSAGHGAEAPNQQESHTEGRAQPHGAQIREHGVPSVVTTQLHGRVPRPACLSHPLSAVTTIPPSCGVLCAVLPHHLTIGQGRRQGLRGMDEVISGWDRGTACRSPAPPAP